jgi:uncharacterized protein YuzE
MDYEGLVEQNVNHMMDKMFGDKDPALKTITKMNILFDGDDDTRESMEKALTKMKKMNYFEAKCIDEELFLTYDNNGNIISVNDIKNESKDEIFYESKSESHTEFIPSDR